MKFKNLLNTMSMNQERIDAEINEMNSSKGMTRSFERFQEIVDKLNNADVTNKSDGANLNDINDNSDRQTDDHSFFLQKFWKTAKRVCDNPITNFNDYINVTFTNYYNNMINYDAVSIKSCASTLTSRSAKSKSSYSKEIRNLKNRFTLSGDKISIFKKAAEKLYTVKSDDENCNQETENKTKIVNYSERICSSQSSMKDIEIGKRFLNDNDVIEMVTKTRVPVMNTSNSIQIYKVDCNKMNNQSIWRKAAEELYWIKKPSTVNLDSSGDGDKVFKRRSSKSIYGETFLHPRQSHSSTRRKNRYTTNKLVQSYNNNLRTTIRENNNLHVTDQNITAEVILSKNLKTKPFDDAATNKNKKRININNDYNMHYNCDSNNNLSKITSDSSSLNSSNRRKIWSKAAKELYKLSSEILADKIDTESMDVTNFGFEVINQTVSMGDSNFGFKVMSHADSMGDGSEVTNFTQSVKNTKLKTPKNKIMETETENCDKYNFKEDLDECTNLDDVDNLLEETEAVVNSDNCNNENTEREARKVIDKFESPAEKMIKSNDDSNKLTESEKPLIILPKCKSLVGTKKSNKVEKYKYHAINCINRTKISRVDHKSKSCSTELNNSNICKIYKKCFSEQQLREEIIETSKLKKKCKHKMKQKLPSCQLNMQYDGNIQNFLTRKNENEIKYNEKSLENTCVSHDCNSLHIANREYDNCCKKSRLHKKENFLIKENKKPIERRLDVHGLNTHKSISTKNFIKNKKSKSQANLVCTHDTNYLNYGRMKFNNYYRVILTCNPALFGGKKKKSNNNINRSRDSLNQRTSNNEKLFPNNIESEAIVFKRPGPSDNKESSILVKREPQKHNSNDSIESTDSTSSKKKKKERQRNELKAKKIKKEKSTQNPKPEKKSKRKKGKLLDESPSNSPSSHIQLVESESRTLSSPQDSDTSISSKSSSRCPELVSDEQLTENRKKHKLVKKDSERPKTPTNQNKIFLRPSSSRHGRTRSEEKRDYDYEHKNDSIQLSSPESREPESPEPESPEPESPEPESPESESWKGVICPLMSKSLILKEELPKKTSSFRLIKKEHKANQVSSIEFMEKKKSPKCKCLECINCHSNSNASEDELNKNNAYCDRYSKILNQFSCGNSLGWSMANLFLPKSLKRPTFVHFYCQKRPRRHPCRRRKGFFCCCNTDCSFKESLKKMFCISLPSKTSSETRTRWVKNKEKKLEIKDPPECTC